eukprot:560157-Pyramimonas_sp.AAC.1
MLPMSRVVALILVERRGLVPGQQPRHAREVVRVLVHLRALRAGPAPGRGANEQNVDWGSS